MKKQQKTYYQPEFDFSTPSPVKEKKTTFNSIPFNPNYFEDLKRKKLTLAIIKNTKSF